MASSTSQRKHLLAACTAAMLLPFIAQAATDLSDVPLSSATTSSVKPNIFFILDDSGSMDSKFMPDGVSSSNIGFRNYLCNTIYYNPATVYTLPKDSTGTNLNNASQTAFTNAYNDGYYSYDGGSSTKTNISTSFSADGSEGGRAAYYWKYKLSDSASIVPDSGACTYSTGSVTSTTTGICCTGTPSAGSGTCSNAEYTTNTPAACTTYTGVTPNLPRTLVWEKVLITSTSGTQVSDINGDGAINASDADERQNFANWYSYYRTRLMMMKAASGRAFQSILDNYRVGFMTISPGTYGNSQTSTGAATGSSISSSKFLKIADFDSTHRADWYSKLYSQTTSSYTPLRSALSTAGRYFAGKNDLINQGMVPTQADDPVQYSCQQNFTILVTDGYWNSGSGRQLDGTSQLGNQDGVLSELDAYNPAEKKFAVSPRPIYDGAITQYIWNAASHVYQSVSCSGTGLQKKTDQWQSRTVTQMKSTSNLQKRTSSLQENLSHVLTSTSTLLTSTATLQSETGTLVGTVSQVLMKCTSTTTNCGSPPANGLPGVGSGTAAWSVVTSCTNGSGTASPRCSRVSPSPTLTRNVVSLCNTGATISNNSPYSTSGTDGGYKYSSCSYNYAAPVAGACTYNVASNPNNTSALTATRCSYTTWTTPTALGACTYQNQTTSTTNGTVYNASPKQCSYSSWTTPGSPGTACTVSAQTTATTDGTAYNTTPKACSYEAWNGWNDIAAPATCTPVAQSTSGTYNTIARQCQYGSWGAWGNVSSGNCTTVAQSGTWNVNPAVQCQYTAWSSPAVADNSCVAAAQSPSSPYTVLTATTCTPSYGAWTNTTGACTASATLQCQAVSGTWAFVSSCTPSGPNASGQQVYCQSGISFTGGSKFQTRTRIAATPYTGPGQTGTAGTTTNTYGTWADVTGTCYAPGLAPATPTESPITGVAAPTIPAGCSSGIQQWPCEVVSTSGGSTNTLADVAQYYYKTDLRNSAFGNCTGALGLSVCDDNVPSTGTDAEADKANWQHMTTFTMGLGLSGTLTFSPTYKTDTTGTFNDLRVGNINWPVPAADSASAIDDLWHAAVDGRGQYFSARDPNSVVTSLQTALSGVSARVASAAAAATSNLEPVAGDNFAYTAKYVTQKWNGELEAHEIDLSTGAVSGTVIWSAATKLNNLVGSSCDNRNIKLFRSGATSNLVDFKWSTYACDGSGNPTGSATTALSGTEQAHFTPGGTDTFGQTVDEIALLSQYPNMSATQRTDAAGANLVNFIRGQRGKEGFSSGPPATNTLADANKLYRYRETDVLGDIISAQPVFVKSPFAEYTGATDPGYSAFKTNQAGRTPMVYVAANDGMLHAFYAGTSIIDTQGGVEAWAFIPTMVLPNLYKRASENYASQHSFTVDGTPTAGDVFDRTVSADCASGTPSVPEVCWKTILVAGLNKGGQGYYALDISDPANPKGLWEFKKSSTCVAVNATTQAPTSTAYADCHLGYSYNNPIISKLSDGRWVVFVTSGYNNDDGIGYLYVLDAITGQILYRISTGVGNASNPSGLNHINGWVDNALFDNTTKRVYGVDLLGNVWRFDVNDSFGVGGREATLVTTVVDSANHPQPIMTRPELGEVSGDPFVFVGTGRYLGTTDIANTDTQTIWAIRDPMLTTPITGLRTTLAERIIHNVGTGTSAYRLVTSTDCAAPNGWYADLPDSGERINIDMKLQLGTLIVPSNVPTSNACSIGGYSWLNYFNDQNGCTVATTTKVGTKLVGGSGTESLAVGINVVRLPNGKTVVIATTSAAEQITLEAPFDTPPPLGKRVSWREIVQ